MKATASHPAERLIKRSESISNQIGDKTLIKISLRENLFIYKCVKDVVDGVLKKE